MTRRICLAAAFFVAALTVLPVAASGQSTAADVPRPMVGAPAPVPPVPPATVSRSPEGGVTVRAVRLTEPLRMDGRLDERIYEEVPAISGFIQQEPREGEPATERTEAWVFFDDRNLYVSARCWDSHPERDIANEMRRDSTNLLQNENFGIMLDTFYDRRNGVSFQVGKLGVLFDVAVTDERDRNADWNAVWDARTGNFEGGWTVEIVIPFKSLRYNQGPNQVWGIQFRRGVRWKNEWSYLTRVPAFMGPRAILSVSLGATMVGLDVPASGKNIDLKPYAISGVRTDRGATPAVSNDADGGAGFDLKYGITKNLTADFTYNTDFAQVEDDEQQVNLTRFNLFFPEKRDFFLEGQGIFAFGGGSIAARGGPSSAPVMFFSRRIGLNRGRPVLIEAGGRLTGKVGKYAIGLLDIQSGDDRRAGARATNFSVVRLKRDVFRRSTIGAIYTRRSVLSVGDGVGETFGVDAVASFSPSLNINAYVARTRAPGRTGDNSSYLGKFDYNTDRYGVQLERSVVERNFDPEIGFLRRQDFGRHYAFVRFSPRPAPTKMRAIRKFHYQLSYDYFVTGGGRLDTRDSQGEFSIEFQNSDRLAVQYARSREFIPSPFNIAANVTVPIGGYSYQSVLVSYTLGTQRKASGELSYEAGTLYNGRKHVVAFSRGRINVTPQLSVEPILSVNQIDLPFGDFTTSVISTRSTFTLTPRMFVSALVQYNSSAHLLSTNARLRWEYLPGSEFFLVYTDGRDTLTKGFPELANRAVVVKINRLFRF